VDYISTFFWLLLMVSMLSPVLQQRRLEVLRLQLMRRLEKRRGSRVIALIHRQERMSLLGIPVFRYMDVQDSEQVLRAIHMTPADLPIDVILHTPGGLLLAAEQIAMALASHPGKVTVFVPHYAMSGGTLIALAADEIVMDCHAALGPVDPQLGRYPAASILQAVARKKVDDVDDETLILADVAEKAMRQVQVVIRQILADRLPADKAEELSRVLSDGRFTHDCPLWPSMLKELGLPVSTDFPKEIHQLMELYPQPVQQRPSVEFIPIPYGPGRPSPPGGSRR
jgi:ClpP class serine protease